MLYLLAPALVLGLCLAVGVATRRVPAPVVVVGLPATPADGVHHGPVELTFTLEPSYGEPVAGAVLELTDPAGASSQRLVLVDGGTQVRVEGAGEHVLDWRVTSADGATTCGSTVLVLA